jgi:hypothetical protein
MIIVQNVQDIKKKRSYIRQDVTPCIFLVELRGIEPLAS